MKILLVSSFLPYPLYSGGHVRLYNIIKQLAKKHTITLVCEKRSYQTQDDINEVKIFCDVYTVDRKKQWSIQNVLKTSVSSYPFLLTGHLHKDMKATLKKLLHEKKFDVIHVETFYVMQNLPKTYIPIVLVEHNVEYLVYQRYVDTLPMVLRPLLYVDIVKIKYWETFYWKQVAKLVAVSEDEKRIMKRLDAAVVPNGVDTKLFQYKEKRDIKEKKLLFIGDFKWIQNQNAATWILKELWPKLIDEAQKQQINIKLWIVSKQIPDAIRALTSDKRVFFDSTSKKSTAAIFQEASLLLAPIFVGGGTSYKILEAMASGTPVITTSLGREGIEASEGKEILIADSPDDFTEKIVSILQQKKTYESMAQNARRVIEKKYNWETIVASLEAVYTAAIKE